MESQTFNIQIMIFLTKRKQDQLYSMNELKSVNQQTKSMTQKDGRQPLMKDIETNLCTDRLNCKLVVQCRQYGRTHCDGKLKTRTKIEGTIQKMNNLNVINGVKKKNGQEEGTKKRSKNDVGKKRVHSR